MGQSNSCHTPPEARTPAQHDDSALSTQHDTPREDPAPRPRKQDRVSTIRRSVFGRRLSQSAPSTADTSSTDVSSSTPDADARRSSWRRSRRWSKTPVSAQDGSSAAEAPEVSSPSSVAPGGTESASRKKGWRMSRRWSTQPLGNAEPESALRSPDAGPSTPAEEGSTQASASPSISAPTGDTLSNPTAAPIVPAILEDASPPPVVAPETTTIPPLNTSSQPSSTNMLSAPGSGFPPAGTLVVVQGMVRTSPPSNSQSLDSERPPASSGGQDSNLLSVPSSRSRPASRNRNRLSTLLNRPPNFGPSSTVADAGSSTSVVSTPVSERSEAPTVVGAPNSALSDASSPRSVPNGRPTPLSASSIDVLGTLITVAATATAASLVSGSSVPLASANGVSSASMPGPTAPAPTTPAQRRRSAWESLRDRIGILRPEEQQPQGPVSESDARRLMLSEMVQALNSGLGSGTPVNGPSGSSASRSAAPSETPGELDMPTTPVSAVAVEGDPSEGSPVANSTEAASSAPQLDRFPEGSFERFLLNLQIDLRRALSADPGDPTSADTSSETPSTPANIPLPAPAADEDDLLRELIGTAADDDQHETGSVEPEVDTLPELGSVFESSAPGSVLDLTPDQASATEIPSPSPTLPSREAPPSDDFQLTPEGNINWWRMFRFPPVPAPQARSPLTPFPGPAEANATASNPPPTTAAPARASNPSEPSDHTSPMPETGTSAASPDAADASATTGPEENMVIPVIVVGLQSLNTDANAADPLAPGTPTMDVPGPDGSSSPSLNSTGRPSTPQTPGTGLASRGRWRERAADALRNLRPGTRRGLDQPNDGGPGSRTFMIYVIGGYYPPNHHIVTGSENLDSFEALLQLAELLGQVKPPTVTKDDIDKSGLEVYKATQLKAYEAEGRISNNCVDRCLICLDDYDPEDDLRLMTCKHTFHKTCVDRWMETGRNNCPACRSQGVPRHGDATAATATEPTPTINEVL